MGQAVAKAELSDPTFGCSTEEAQQIKVTPGITGWLRPSVNSDGAVRDLDVGSSHPGGAEAPKGLAVRQLKRYASWVQTVNKEPKISRIHTAAFTSNRDRINRLISVKS